MSCPLWGVPKTSCDGSTDAMVDQPQAPEPLEKENDFGDDDRKRKRAWFLFYFWVSTLDTYRRRVDPWCLLVGGRWQMATDSTASANICYKQQQELRL